MDNSSIEQILESSYKDQQSTLENYMHRLTYLRDKIFRGENTYYSILKDPEESYRILREKYPNINTRKNYLTLILALFKNSDRLQEKLKPEMDRWKTFHGHMDSFQEAKAKKHAPDAKQIAKYTSFEEIELKYQEIRKSEDAHPSLKESLRFVLLSIIVGTPPKRSDYGRMKIYYEDDPNEKEGNYIVLRRDEPSYMVFNKYKTSKRYKRVDQELPKKTTRDIKDSVRRYPREYLFVNKSGEPFETNNSFTKYVIRVFRNYFGRDTGMTMLRHIFITEKVSFDEMDDDELEGIARDMMHSTGLQRRYKWNPKNVRHLLKIESSNEK